MLVRPLLALLTSALQAQSPGELPPANDAIYASAVDPAVSSGNDYLSLFDDGYVRIEPDGRREYTVRQVVKVLTNDGAAVWGEHQYSYDPDVEHFRINWMRVIEDGEVVREGPEHQQETAANVDQSAPVYTNSKLLQATLAGVRPGAIVDYSVTWETYAPRLTGDYGQGWRFNELYPVLQSRFVLDVPDNVEPRLIIHNVPFSPRESHEGGRHLLEWTTSDIPAFDNELFATYPNDVIMTIEVTGELTWDNITHWYRPLLDGRYELTDAIREAHDAKLAGATSARDSLAVTYNWVAQDFRYVSLSLGDGSYQPRMPAEVFDSRFGDCKDKTMLFVALARRLGVHAVPVLANLSNVVDSLQPTLGQFDHMIARVDSPDGPLFLDLTTTMTPYGELPAQLQGGVGVVVEDDGTAEVVVMPRVDPESNVLSHEVTGRLGRDNRFVGTLTISGTGSQQYWLRNQFHDYPSMSQDDQNEVLRNLVQGVYSTATVDSSEVFDGLDTNHPASVKIWFTADGVLGQAGAQYMMYMPIFDFTNPSVAAQLEADSVRSFPLAAQLINEWAIQRFSFEVQLPSRWTVTAPSDVVSDGVFGRYSGTYKQTGSRFKAVRELEGKRGIFPPDSVAALVAWLGEVGEDNERYVAIDRNGTAGLDPIAMDSTAGGIAALLLTPTELGTGARLASEGPTQGEGALSFGPDEAMQDFKRTFTADQMVFNVGSSQIMFLDVTGEEYATHGQAIKNIQFTEIVDMNAAMDAAFTSMLGEQMTMGEVRDIEFPELETDASGWLLPVTSPFGSFDMVIATMVRGRVAVTVTAVAATGISGGDIAGLFATMDERVREVPAFLDDLDEEAAADKAEDLEGEEYASLLDDISVQEMLPSADQFDGARSSSAGYRMNEGFGEFYREFEGVEFTFRVGGTEAVSLKTSVTIADDDAHALQQVLIAEAGMLGAVNSFASGDDPQSALLFAGGDSSSADIADIPGIGSRSVATVANIRAGLRVDIGFITFSAGRVIARVALMGRPGAIDIDDVQAVALDMYRRIRETDPELSSPDIDPDVIAAVERIMLLDAEVDSLAHEREFDRVFELLEQADLENAPVSLDPSTWNSVCWWGALEGYVEQAMPACEAAVLPDSTNLPRRDSRGLARALAGDTQGAIEDFSYIVDNAATPFTGRAEWLDALLAGENPFTEEVLEGLRD